MSAASRELSPIEKMAFVAAANARGLAAHYYAKEKAAADAALAPALADLEATTDGLSELLNELGIPSDATPRLDGDTLRW